MTWLPIRSILWTMRYVVLLTPAAVFGADLHTQHAADTSLQVGPLKPLWHVRLRTTPQGGGVAQVRTGPIISTDLHDRLTLIVGYYYARAKQERWTSTHRPFGGAEVVVWNRSFEVDARSLLECFVVSAATNYTRFRNRLRVSPKAKTAPYIGVESFIDREGLRSMRYSAGVRRTFAKDLSLDVGYFYESRRQSAGQDRHMLTTTIHWHNRARRMDPDP